MNTYFDVFISYGRKESLTFAIELQEKLTAAGLNVWFDKNDIPPTVDFQRQIDDAIEKAHNFIYVIAPHAVKSPFCGLEIDLAVKRNKRIIPLFHVEPSDCWDDIHPQIAKRNWIFFDGSQAYDKAFQQLLAVIDTHKDYVYQHTQFLEYALTWERQQKQTQYLLVAEELAQAKQWLHIHFPDQQNQAPCEPTDLHCDYICESIKNANNLMTQAFISYAETERSTMAKVRMMLHREMITVWTNKTDIHASSAFQIAIKNGIEGADNFIYLLSPDSIASHFCQKELTYALALNKRIILLLIKPVPFDNIPEGVKELQFIDCIQYDDEIAIKTSKNKLFKVLKESVLYHEKHKILLVKALKWKEQTYNPSILLRGYALQRAEAWLKAAAQREAFLPLPLHEAFISASQNQPPNASQDVFIAYSRIDADFARKLNEALQTQGKTTWFDQENIEASADFQQEIYHGIENSDNFLFILSPASLKSPYCAEEVEYAHQLNKRIVTVLYRSFNQQDIHPLLEKIQWIDFTHHNTDFYTNFSELTRTLETDREHVRAHTKWLQRAKEWQEKRKSHDLLLRGTEFELAKKWIDEAQQLHKRPQPSQLQTNFIQASYQAILTAQKREKQRTRFLNVLLVLVSISLIIALSEYHYALLHQQRAEKGEIVALSANSEAKFTLDRPFEALQIGLEAAHRLENSTSKNKNNVALRTQVVTALQQSLYSVREFNQINNEGGIVSFSPDNQIVAIVTQDDIVELFDFKGNLLTQFGEGHQLTKRLKFSPDGNIIAVVSRNNKIKLWQRNGTLLTTIENNEPLKFWKIEFNQTADVLLVETRTGKIKIWNTKTGQLLKILADEKGIKQAFFGCNGQCVAIVTQDDRIKIWYLDNRAAIIFDKIEKGLLDIDVHPQYPLIVILSVTGQVHLWDLSKATTKILPAIPINLQNVAFTNQGNAIIGFADNMLQFWDLTGVATHYFDKIDKNMQIHRSPDESILMKMQQINLRNTVVELWSKQGELLGKLEEDNFIDDFQFSPDGKIIATTDEKAIKLWNTNGKLITTLNGHNDTILDMRFSADSQTLVSTSYDSTTRFWHINNTVLRQIDTENSFFSYQAQNRQLIDTIATHTHDEAIRLWSNKGKLIKAFDTADNSKSYLIQFSPHNHFLTTLPIDNQADLQLWQADGTLIKTLVSKKKEIDKLAIHFLNEDYLLVAIGEKFLSQTIQLWRTDGTFVKTLLERDAQDQIIIKYHAGGQYFVTLPKGKENYGPIQLWQANGQLIKNLISFKQHYADVDVEISANSQRILTIIKNDNNHHAVQLWNEKGQLVKTLFSENQQITKASFSPQGHYFVTEIQHGAVQLWSAQNGKLITTIQKKLTETIAINFSYDDQQFVVGYVNGALELWSTRGEKIRTLLDNNLGTWSPHFNDDNSMLIFEEGNTIKLWQLEKDVIIKLTHSGNIADIAFNDTQQLIATASHDHTIKLWHKDGTLISTLKGHREPVLNVYFSADGQRLISKDIKSNIIINELSHFLKLDDLHQRGCEWLRYYLKGEDVTEEALLACHSELKN